MARSRSGSPDPRRRAVVGLLLALPATGALVAALLVPWVVGPGLAASSSASLLAPLPVELTDATKPGNTVVLAADGSVITYFYRDNRTPVTADRIADVMEQALVDIEDERFYEHNGLDVQGTARALVRNVSSGGVQEGGSTITQQLVKQTLLQTAVTAEERAAATEQTVGRKLREARLALALEETYAKEEILTRYLNTVYFGEGAYGVQAAAQAYFGVDAADLDLPQAAMLAGLVQTPAADSPLVDPDRARERRNVVLGRMHARGHITDAQLAEISAQPVQTAPAPAPPNGCAGAVIGGFFCDFLQQHLVGTLGVTQEQLETGGLTIRTTMRADLQRSADAAVLATQPMGDPVAAMFTAVEPGTGAVLAMSANRVFGYDVDDPAQESLNLNVAASKGSGSTYKVFVATAALERGLPPTHTLTAPEPYTSRVYRNGLEPYTVGNVGDSIPARLSMHEALVRSSNTYFVALEDELGSVEGPVRVAQRLGLTSLDSVADQVVAENRGSFTLGPEATSPLALASAYSTLAANGTRCTPVPVVEVLDRDGRPLTRADGSPLGTGASCTPEVVSPQIATTVNQMLVSGSTAPYGTGRRAAIPGHQVATKTGTAQDRASVSFVGSTPRYTASVMLFNPTANEDVGGYGGSRGGQIWHDAFLPILSAEEPVPFPPPGIPLPPLPGAG
ncbi:Membrane carboxypeptidase (penicillin-binding protein) [Geodermatophilus pulveris]|uniref:Membrane carboxypeptidase (Penicillin-binding protein) n=1 Tax=Geodermatophilus pulveris TaxID=1564159 RepID=A0A239JDQ3_9ACTN|nr:transglycosylase domain-containing protein [Geodermatophilus pulveris]SNT03732.1 Membrane carboxypeptidase (penicillin-binding protein) [Geodermatophilus pulveris]